MSDTLHLLDDPLSGYQVELPDFQGPLDLLLNLIEQEELDITKISLARVTDQYLAHLELLKATDPDDLTDFLVIAAKLILIKSEMLLPRPPPILLSDEEEDVGDELARQLLLYKQFKELAVYLKGLEGQGQRSYVRVAPLIRVEPKLQPGDGNVSALLEAARQALAIKPENPDVDEMIAPHVVTIGQQMVHIWQRLTEFEEITLDQLLGTSHSRLVLIVTVLAILELIKRNIILVEQRSHFSDINIRKRDRTQNLSEPELAELVGLLDIS
jgi:segregation and condensation protein A